MRRNLIEKAFIEWWNRLKKQDTRAICSLASSEAWYQFEFGKYFQLKYCGKYMTNDIYIEKNKVDITINGIQIECKMIWNNKNILDAVEGVIEDGKSIKASRKGGYLVLFMAFSKKYPNAEFPPSYGNTCHGWKLQPTSKDDDFTIFSENIWKSIKLEIKTRLKLRHNPFLMPKIETNYFWHSAVIWKVG